MTWWEKLEQFLWPIVYGDKPMPETPQNEPTAPVVPIVSPTPTPPPSPTPNPTNLPLITLLALAIQSREGWYGPGQLAGFPNGTRAYINCNPGNDRWEGGPPYPLGATGVDADGFLIFKTYTDGFDYLCNAITALCKGDVAASNPYQVAAKAKGLHDCSYLTLEQYFVIRDPSSDNNNPVSYAAFAAGKVGKTVSTMLRQLLP